MVSNIKEEIKGSLECQDELTKANKIRILTMSMTSRHIPAGFGQKWVYSVVL